jgi:hypothetical protein
MHTVEKSYPLLHKIILQYMIIPSYNTWRAAAVSGVVKHQEPLKSLFIILFVRFAFLLHSSDIRVCWLEG